MTGSENANLNRARLVEKVQASIGVSVADARLLVEHVISCLRDELVEGSGRVKISGFGTFLVRQKTPRLGRNPHTTKRLLISGRRVLSFKPSALLRAAINEGSER